MKSIVKLGLVMCAAGALSYAESLSGTLLDSACYDKNSQDATKKAQAATQCAASEKTTSFAIQTSDGKVLKLDSSGNSKAVAAMKEHKGGGAVRATVAGDVEGSTIKVSDVDVQ
jgi:hypothetical protein